MTGIDRTGVQVDVDNRRPRPRSRRPSRVDLIQVRLCLVAILADKVELSDRQIAAILNTNQTAIHRLRRQLAEIGAPSLSLAYLAG